MNDFKSCLIKNYKYHPAFIFDMDSWHLSTETLSSFNDIYQTLRTVGVALNQESLSRLHNDCFDALKHIFSDLQKQTADDFEQQFLLELEQHCLRLLKTELLFYSKPRVAGFASVSGNSMASEQFVDMQTKRHFFGQLSQDIVNEIRLLAADDLQRFRTNASAGCLKREDLSVNDGYTVQAITRILNAEFGKLGVLDAVGAYMGTKMQVAGLALELSVPQATWWHNALQGLTRPPRTLYAHFDESIVYPKSIVYLSDVTNRQGPTSCYPGVYEQMSLNPLQEMIGRIIGITGTDPASPLKSYYSKQYHQSVNSENFRRHYMRLPESLRFYTHLGWDVMPDSELEEQLTSAENTMTGPAGTFIAFDGARLLHRGGMVLEGERVALQVIFSEPASSSLVKRVIGKFRRMSKWT